jgi:hypothetical protein
MQANDDPDDDDDEDEDAFFPTHNSKGEHVVKIITNAAGDKIPTTAWDYAIDFRGAIPRLNFDDIASEKLVQNAKAERGKAEGSNADSFGDASELMRAGRGRVPEEEAGGYWLPKRVFAGDGAAIALQEYQEELLQKINRKRMQLTADDEEAEAYRDYLALPSMEKFVSEDRKSRTAALTREE